MREARKTTAAASLAIVCTFVAAILCPMDAAAALRPVYGGNARIGADGPITTLDPAHANFGAERLLARATHCTVSDIVASVDAVDESTSRLRLLSNLFFHDGTPIMAEDVKRSLLRAASMQPPSPAAWRLLAITTPPEDGADVETTPAISVIDGRTLEVSVHSEDIDVLEWLDAPSLAIVRADGKTGCGPFRPTSRAMEPASSAADDARSNAKEVIRLEAFERHPKGRPFLDSVEIVVFEPGISDRSKADGLDAATGRGAARPEASTVEDAHLAAFRLEGELRSDSKTRLLLDSLDRSSVSRLLMGPGSRAVESLSGLLVGGAAAGSSSAEVEAVGTSRRTSRLIIGYQGSDPALRRIAERAQLALHDEGVRAVISPLKLEDRSKDARLPRVPLIRMPDRARITTSLGRPHVLLDIQHDLPRNPIRRLVAVAHHHGGLELAARALVELLQTEEGSFPEELVADLEAEAGLVPIATVARRMWLSDELQCSAPSRLGQLDPAYLWRLPDDVSLQTTR